MTVRYQYDNASTLACRLDLQAAVKPLPCRGCTVNCPDFKQCKGKPWRLAEELTGGSRQ